MHRIIQLGLVAGLAALAPGPVRGVNTNTFELRDGDRVLLLGDTLVEREQRYGYLEYALTTRFPDRTITFRGLGWSADYPGRPAALFNWANPPQAWLDHLLSQIRVLQPTVVFLGYGMSASFQGKSGLADFKGWLTRLLDAMRAADPQVRFVVLSPIRHEKRPPAAADPEPHNEQLNLYVQVLHELAGSYNAHFVSFFELLNNDYFLALSPPLTESGTELNDYGCRRAAEVLGQQLGWHPPTWRLGITTDGREREGAYGAKVLELERKEDRLRLVTLDEVLVPPPPLNPTNVPPSAAPDCRIQAQGMKPGRYELRIDGRPVQSADARSLEGSGIRVRSGPQFEQARELLGAIRKKNELFAEFWRSWVQTHLSQPGARQGQPPQTTPPRDIAHEAVAAEEASIARLKKPVPHTLELILSAGEQSQAPGPSLKPD